MAGFFGGKEADMTKMRVSREQAYISNDALRAEVERLKARCDKWSAQAARYMAIRGGLYPKEVRYFVGDSVGEGDAVDAAIDAAMKGEG